MSTGRDPCPDVVAEGPLKYLVEQLWAPALASGDVRLVTRAGTTGWETTERYLVAPTWSRASMLLPAAGSRVTRGALLNYRGLRRPVPNLQRRMLGAALRAGVPLPFPKLDLALRVGGDETILPLGMLRRQLGTDALHASIGVRTGANRKATLQLVDDIGSPAGFAKFAWDESSRTGVTWEAQALRTPLTTGPARTPALISTGAFHGQPFIVTAPLPLTCRGVRAGVPPPTPAEMYALAPVLRRDAVAGSGQFQAMHHRLAALGSGDDAGVRTLLGETRALVTALEARPRALPIGTRWHGDLTPWNSARDLDGVLWCWDWESSEPDAVAGMDALHWFTTVRTETGHALDGSLLTEAAQEAAPYLTAAGTDREDHSLVLGTYVATVVERACALAAGTGGWEAGWVLPAQLRDMVAVARASVARTAEGPR